MMKMMIRLLLLALLASTVIVVGAQEDDDEELPVIPYVSSEGAVEKFNIPIPEGWRNVGTAAIPHFVRDGVEADIYVIAVAAEDEASGLIDAVQQIIPEFDADPIATGQLNMDGNIWSQQIFTLDNGDDVTVFNLYRDAVDYALVYVNREPDSDFYMVATRPDETGVQQGVDEAMLQLYPDFEADLIDTEEITLSNGLWARNDYGEIDGEAVSTLAQLRGNTTFVVIEQGDAGKIETVNKAFYSVLFGFFVTPDSGSYLLLALGVVFGLLALLVGSMFIRYQNLKKDMLLLEQLKNEA